MDKQLQSIVEKLKHAFGSQVQEFREDVSLFILPEKIVAACEQIRSLGFELLSTLSAVDYWPQQDPRFHLIYQFTSVSMNLCLAVRVPVNGIKPVIPTVSHIYHNANWRERELWDMFGIKAEGHPDLRRLLLPVDWEGHPLRKDYPLGYEEPQFSFNIKEIDLRKPYAKE